MSVIKAYQTYQTLSTTQKRFIKEKLFESSFTPEAWLRFLRTVSEFDKYGDSGRKFAGVSSCLGLIVIIASLFLFATLAQFLPTLVLYVLQGIVIICVILGAITYFKLKSIDVPNKLRNFVVPAVAILREDMNREEPLNLRMDLRGSTIKEKQTDENKPEKGYPKILEKHFVDQWFAGSARLADSSILQWQIVDHVRQRRITKRNPRGKTKIKMKYKIKTLIDVHLGLRQKDYIPLSPDPRADQQDKIDVKQGDKRNRIRVRRTIVSTDQESVLELNDFLDAVASAYKQVKLSRAG